jgi:hypothetical protein
MPPQITSSHIDASLNAFVRFQRWTGCEQPSVLKAHRQFVAVALNTRERLGYESGVEGVLTVCHLATIPGSRAIVRENGTRGGTRRSLSDKATTTAQYVLSVPPAPVPAM